MPGNWLRRLSGAAFCVLAMGCADVALAQDRTLTPQALRSEAALALDTGQPQIAAQFAQALLARDPEDFGALLIFSRAARTLGETAAAKEAAAQAWAVADTEDERFAAAMIRAQALASAGQRTQAQLWLRQAVEIAPNEQLKRVAMRDFGYVRARNPWATYLNFSVAPSSNINNGSRSATGTYDLPVFGVVDASLDGAARALSGIEYAAAAQFRYRLRQTNRSQTDVIFGGRHITYTLSDESREDAPGVEGSDFAYTSLQGTLIQRGFAGAATRPFQLSGTLSRTWYGGEEYMQFGVLGLRQSFVFEGGNRIEAELGRRWQETLSTRTSDSDTWDLGLAWRSVMRDGHQVRLGVGWRESRSESTTLDYQETSLRADLVLGKPLFGAQIEMSLHLGLKEHPEGPVAGETRTDHSARARVTAVLRNLDYYGFVPTVTLSARRTESDFGQYDAEELGLNLGLRSAF